MRNQLNTLQEDIKLSEDSKTKLEFDLGILESKKGALVRKLEELTVKFDADRVKIAEQIQQMEQKLKKVTTDFLEAQRTEQISREDIAKRKLALDERETVLNIRERKVDMAEQTIQNNSNLLNL